MRIKRKIKQIFCRHKNKNWYRKNTSGFQIISGEELYLVCEECGKILDTMFNEYEGMGRK